MILAIQSAFSGKTTNINVMAEITSISRDLCGIWNNTLYSERGNDAYYQRTQIVFRDNLLHFLYVFFCGLRTTCSFRANVCF